MHYVMCGYLENDIGIHYTKEKTKFGLITVVLDRNIKSNFFERSISNKEKAKVVILKQPFLSDKYCKLLKKDTTVLLKGELIKTPIYVKAKREFTRKDIKSLDSNCVLFLGEHSDISILSFPKKEELENKEFYKTNILNFNCMLAKA